MKYYRSLVIFFIFSLILISCSSNDTKPNSTSNTEKVSFKSNTLETTISTPSPTLIPTSSELPTLISPKNKFHVPILYYHSVTDNIFGIEELHVSPQKFDEQMKYLKDNNFDVITFDELEKANYYNNPIMITFDDGYLNNYTEAYPILKKYNFRATIFICTSYIDQPDMISKENMKEMSNLINFQSHTLSHPDLDKLSQTKIEEELSKSKDIISEITGKQVNSIAYPTGKYNKTVIEITKKYYKYGLLNVGGIYNGSNNYEIKRVYIPRNLTLTNFIKKLKTGLL